MHSLNEAYGVNTSETASTLRWEGDIHLVYLAAREIVFVPRYSGYVVNCVCLAIDETWRVEVHKIMIWGCE
jgi:hypothetical protein